MSEGTASSGNCDKQMLRVLIVDDDEFQHNILGWAIKQYGVYEVVHAFSGVEAMHMVGQGTHEPDVIITDLEMPDMDGMEFLRNLSEIRVRASILVLSGKDEGILRSVELMAREYGLSILGVMAKPVEFNRLHDILQGLRRGDQDQAARQAKPVFQAEELQAALTAGEFEPYFQPQVELKTGRLAGVEALARWRHPTFGLLSPYSFIQPLEDHGLTQDLTWQMLTKSLPLLEAWHKLGIETKLSVNLNHSCLANTEIAKRIKGLMADYRLREKDLVIEITETTAMTDVAHCLETLVRLRMMGFGLSIDDFGTGHSSLQQLSRIPFTELKIDRDFVRGAANRPHLHAVLEYSIQIARKLGLSSVGEGIETAEDLECLQKLGCDLGQGYSIARPMSSDNFLDWALDWQKTL